MKNFKNNNIVLDFSFQFLVTGYPTNRTYNNKIFQLMLLQILQSWGRLKERERKNLMRTLKKKGLRATRMRLTTCKNISLSAK